MRDRRRALVVLAIAATAGLSGAALGAVGTVLVTRDCSFSQATWEAGRENGADYEVLKHDLRLLVRCGTLDGASERAVASRLGPPDGDRNGDWRYDVGVPDMLSDYPEFHVRFDAGGRVRDAQVPGYVEPRPYMFFFGTAGSNP